MPFVKKIFDIPSPLLAFVFVQNTLECSNKEAQRVIDKGRLRMLDQSPIKKAQKISGQVILEVFEPELTIRPFFVHQDFALYHKPHNLLTHPKGRFMHQSLCDSIKAFFGKTANPVHRLDYETAGILLVSRNKKSDLVFKELFEQHQVKKTYLALVKGKILKDRIINSPIATPKPQDKIKDLGIKSQIHPLGKTAITHLRVLEHFKDTTLLELTPITGRTHQLRLHLASIGHPIVGEPLYGVQDDLARSYLSNKLSSQNVLKLQAQSLSFVYEDVRYHLSTPISFCANNASKKEDL